MKPALGSLLTLTAAGGLFLASAPATLAAPGAHGRCHIPASHPPSDQIVFRTSKLVVIRHLTGRYNDHHRFFTATASYRACWRATGRTFVYVNQPTRGIEPVIGFRASGDWLVYNSFGGSSMIAKGTGVIASVDVKTGRRGPVVRQAAGVVAGAGGYIPGGLEGSTQLAVTTDGDFAWVSDAGGQLVSLYTPDGRGGDRLLDSAPNGAITQLRSDGQAVTWLNAGQPKAATLP